MKIAITGGTGFVGRHLAERLLVEGHEVVVVARHAGQGKSPHLRQKTRQDGTNGGTLQLSLAIFLTSILWLRLSLDALPWRIVLASIAR